MKNLKYFLSILSEIDWSVYLWAVGIALLLICGKETITNKNYEVREMMQREAVFAGHAEWIAGTNGEPVFSWKDCK